jgi:hypothetical protein
MKALTLLIWFCWGALCARVLLAPIFPVSLKEGLLLFVVCAPAIGALWWVRWVLRPKKEQRGVVGQLF